MGTYFRNPGMINGQFRCYNCGKLLLHMIKGEYELALKCPRCKVYITVKTKEKIPLAEGSSAA